MKSNSNFRLCALAVVIGGTLTGCASLESDKIDYKTASKGISLEVPPDLTQLSRDNRYQILGGTGATLSTNSLTMPGAVPTAASAIGDVRIERSGNQRWLVVKRPPEALWSTLRDFWLANGFVLTTDEQTLGILETDWAENRAKLPQDFIRNTIGKVFDQLFSTGERDRYRTRLERLPNGDTEIYISHRGLTEQLTPASALQGSSTIWVAREADSEMEAEFLKRLMLRLGAPVEQSKSTTNAAPTRQASSVQINGNQAALILPEPFDLAWRRVGLALDRTGFTVVDRDSSKGVYSVRYAPLNATNKEPGFLSKLFGSSEQQVPVRQYKVKIVSANGQSTITVQDLKGELASLADAQQILNLLAQDLR